MLRGLFTYCLRRSVLFKVCEKFLKYFFIFKQEDLKVFVSKYS